ncbi:MAG: N-acetylmuramoyl-L-alanine amidase, partial [Pseudomonadota bacterium]
AIQRAVGVTDDGIPGHRTARGVAAALDLSAGELDQVQFAADQLVTGKAQNIRRIAIHCTATREGQDFDAATIKRWHVRQGWSDIGYHFVIRLDGTVERGRPEHIPGAHVSGFNRNSIAIVYVGGLDAQAKSKDTRTVEQKAAMADLVRALLAAYPGADVLGHRDHSPDKDGDGVIEPHEWLKDCPCFDARAWWESVK